MQEHWRDGGKQSGFSSFLRVVARRRRHPCPAPFPFFPLMHDDLFPIPAEASLAGGMTADSTRYGDSEMPPKVPSAPLGEATESRSRAVGGLGLGGPGGLQSLGTSQCSDAVRLCQTAVATNNPCPPELPVHPSFIPLRRFQTASPPLRRRAICHLPSAAAACAVLSSHSHRAQRQPATPANALTPAPNPQAQNRPTLGFCASTHTPYHPMASHKWNAGS